MAGYVSALLHRLLQDAARDSLDTHLTTGVVVALDEPLQTLTNRIDRHRLTTSRRGGQSLRAQGLAMYPDSPGSRRATNSVSERPPTCLADPAVKRAQA